MRRSIEAITLTSLMVMLLLIPASTWAQGTWTTKAPMPTPRGSVVVGAINGNLYVVGGFYCCPPPAFNGLTVNEVYSPTTDSWTTAAPAPTPRNSMAAGVISGQLHVVGGTNSGGNQAIHEVFDPITNGGGTLPSMIFARTS